MVLPKQTKTQDTVAIESIARMPLNHDSVALLVYLIYKRPRNPNLTVSEARDLTSISWPAPKGNY